MKSTRRMNIVRGIASILLAVFSFYYVSATLFPHTHVIDGATITHSHIHGGEHDQSSDGGHSKSELTLISYLGTFIALTSATLIVCFSIINGSSHPIVARSCRWVEYQLFGERSPRAPPVLC